MEVKASIEEIWGNTIPPGSENMSTVINVPVALDCSQFCLVPGVSFTEQPLALSVATVSLRTPSLHQAVLSLPLVGQDIN